MKREEAKREDTWALEDLYATEAEYQADFHTLKDEIRAFRAYQGRLSEKAGLLLQALEAFSKMSLRNERVYVYANQCMHQDMGNHQYQKMALEAQNLMNQLNMAIAFLEPELIRIPEGRLEEFIAEENGL